MSTDRELLELAAKAVGMDDLKYDGLGFYRGIGEHEDGMLAVVCWNPLTDDGDAFRLSVKLGLMVDSAISDAESKVIATGVWECEKHGDDPCAATRRAIVQAAASIGAKS